MSFHSTALRSSLLKGASGIVMVAALGVAGQATAQTAKASVLADVAPTTVQDVVITAERRDSTIQKTPESITAVTANTLDKTFATQVADLNAVVPSLEITHTSGIEQLVTIRGVGSETPENSASTTPGVSMFVDGVYLANSISLDETLFDIDHIEVLRGPQGDLYGESSVGGAVIIDTKAPRLHVYDGSGDVSFGDYQLFRIRAETNIPVGDDFAIRASVQHYEHEGFATDTSANLAGFKEDDANDTSGKLALLWKPTDHFTATLTGEWYLADTHGAEQKNIDDPNSNPRLFDQDFAGLFNLAQQIYHLNLDWDLPWFEVKSVTAYQHFDHVTREDSSRSSFAFLGSYDDVPGWSDVVSNFNEEFDILSKSGGPLEWIIGGFGENVADVSTTREYEGPANSCASDPGPVIDPGDLSSLCSLSYGNVSTSTRQGWAAFGRVTYHLLPNLSVSAGARYNWDQYLNNSYNFSQFGTSDNTAHYTHATPTWRFEADYELTPVNMLYASYARGYKPGGVNGSPCIGFACPQVVKNQFVAETNDGYEVGSKNYFLDHTLQLNVDAFYYDHHNFQYIQQDPVPFDDGMSNVPHVRDYGAEFEAHYRGMDSKLHIDATLSLEKGEVIGKYLTIDSTTANALEGPDYSGNNSLPFFGPCAFSGAYYNPACWAAVEATAKNIQGKSPPAMPDVAGSADVAYDFDLSSGVLTPWLQYTYRGFEWARIFNEPSLDKVPAYGLTNLNVTFVPEGDKHLKLTFTATNIFNVVGINSQYTDPYGTAQTSRQYTAPRQVIGTVAVSF